MKYFQCRYCECPKRCYLYITKQKQKNKKAMKTTTNTIETFKLNSGYVVFAKANNPVTYVNNTQVLNAIAKLRAQGVDCYSLDRGRVKFIGIK